MGIASQPRHHPKLLASNPYRSNPTSIVIESSQHKTQIPTCMTGRKLTRLADGYA